MNKLSNRLLHTRRVQAQAWAQSSTTEGATEPGASSPARSPRHRLGRNARVLKRPPTEPGASLPARPPRHRPGREARPLKRPPTNSGAPWSPGHRPGRAEAAPSLLEESQEGRALLVHSPTEVMIADALTELATAEVINILTEAMEGRLPAHPQTPCSALG